MIGTVYQGENFCSCFWQSLSGKIGHYNSDQITRKIVNRRGGLMKVLSEAYPHHTWDEYKFSIRQKNLSMDVVQNLTTNLPSWC